MKRNFFRRAVPWLLLVCLTLPGSVLPAQKQVVRRAAALVEADVVRFLEQASFGPTDALIARVSSMGYEAWLTEQFNAPVSGYPNLTPYPRSSQTGCPMGSPTTCFRDNYTMYPLQVKFFQSALTGEDQLRQRVAFALSQILVVSGVQIQQPSSMAPYLNLLTNQAFGNYRQILYDLTLNPAMGDYLDMANNNRPNLTTGVAPNENYAREILQLFSIGTELLDESGQSQGEPSYDEDIIEGFAHVFTGWTYAVTPGATPRANNQPYYVEPLFLYRNASGVDVNHDKGAKKLLKYPGARYAAIAPNQDGVRELEQAIDNIFYHPNVGPFIGKQLIQRLVTSNPSPAYVRRVAAAFDDNGAGVRGDLKAVVKAILLDQEARGAAKDDPIYGKLREPVLFVTGALRAFGVTSDGDLAGTARNMGQNLFNAPSVFNYYPPDYVVPSTKVLGPEFAIQASSTALARINFVNTAVFGRFGAAAPAGTQVDLAPWQQLAASPTALIARLNRLLLHNTMSAQMQSEVLRAVNAVSASNPKLRAQTALYLVAGSSQYQVER